MGASVRQAKHGKQDRAERNWVVTHEQNFAHLHIFEPGCPITYSHTVRTYTCTNWADAIGVADDLANGRRIDVATVVALSERRV